MIERIAAWLTALLAATGVWGVFFAILLESACVPLPREIILPFAGILVSQGSLSFWGAVWWAMAGQLVGSVLAYYIGLYGGRPFILRYGRCVLVRQHELDVVERWFQRYGEMMAFVSLPAGMARMPLWRFLLYTFLGAFPWTAALIWAGMKVGKVWEDPKWHSAFRLLDVAVVVGLVALVIWYLVKRRRTGSEAAD